ncbi:strongly similar to RNA polymerase sigma factor for flagellar operon [Candidatus Kuenenia stuttgartiensis]|uniref:Strongly similar to RNA polymerase sigma factor for flagellar operon n=1 Tax=Kuenenia stuttgartiensis TaxID=174633 RepID=A0A2C9CBP8_KUEST|nr:strongly similar to RNA polymerase sigma factor for flagellar operon [Candidatus Kuenenia stuttgartiensis]
MRIKIYVRTKKYMVKKEGKANYKNKNLIDREKLVTEIYRW